MEYYKEPLKLPDGRFTELYLYIFFREYKQGSLLNVINNNHLNVQEKIYLFRQLCDCLKDLHKIGLAHLDIKPENSVFDNKKGLMLIDMESAVPLDKEIQITGGTEGYNAPERDGIIYCSPEKADMFSLGAVASVLMS